MRILYERAKQRAVTARQRKIDELAEELSVAAPDLKVHAVIDGVAITGRRALHRWLIDPAMRFAGGGIK